MARFANAFATLDKYSIMGKVWLLFHEHKTTKGIGKFTPTFMAHLVRLTNVVSAVNYKNFFKSPWFASQPWQTLRKDETVVIKSQHTE